MIERMLTEIPSHTSSLFCIYLQERTEPTEEEQDQESSLKQNFRRIAGEDMEIDAYELQEILNAVFQRGGFQVKCTTVQVWSLA